MFAYNKGISTYIFLFSYFLWVFFIHISGSQYFTLFDGDFLLKTFNSGVMGLLLVYVFISYSFNKSSLFDLIITIVFAIGYLHFKKGVLIYLFIILCRKIPFSFVMKTFLLATISGMLFILMTYIFNLYPETYLDLFREDGTYRYLLGYRFPTFLPNYYFHLVLCWFFIRKKNITLGEILLILSINYPIYLFTDTKAAYGLVILSCLAVLFVKYFHIAYSTLILGRLYRLFTKYSFVIFAAIAIYFQYTYDPSFEWMGKLNTMFSGRLALGHWGFELYGIQPFGNLVEFTTMLEASDTNKFFYIDSAYVQLLLVYGAIIFILVCVGYMRIGQMIVANNDQYFGLVLIILFAHSITDPQLMSPEFNPFLLCLGYYGLDKYHKNIFR
ncbi:MAG: hypothetical protein Q4A81_03190 [Pasteurellaceae bacterium]|nr:hypothetical protein [Pasteurellaceae bacterium]